MYSTWFMASICKDPTKADSWKPPVLGLRTRR